MSTPRTPFDWTAWYAKIPGIPTDWGFTKTAEPSPFAPLPRGVLLALRRRRLRLAR